MSALDTLKELVGGRPEPYAATLDPFLEIDVDTLAQDMNLEAEGKKRGEANLPPPDSQALDDVELSIAERIENEASRAYQECIHELRTIDGRLHGLDLEGSFTAARGAASSAIAEFVAEARRRQSQITARRKAVQHSAVHLEEFRDQNQLTRLAHDPLQGIAYWGSLSGAVIVEGLINSIFLRVNDDLGYVGGAIMAFAIAVVNVFLATVCGKFVMPQKNSIRTGVRIRAITFLAGYVVVAAALNLVGAHYRYLKGLGTENPGGVAIEHFLANPVGIPDFISWLLVAFGLGCSFLALWAGYRSDDEYPDYGRKTRQYEQVLEEYDDALADAHDALTGIKDDANSTAAKLERKLTRDRREYASALSSRASLLALYRNRHPSLESAGNRLLGIYRTANRMARSTPAPERFDERWTLRPLSEPVSAAPPAKDRELDEELASTRRALSDAVEKINDAFVRHVESFKSIDELLV